MFFFSDIASNMPIRMWNWCRCNLCIKKQCIRLVLILSPLCAHIDGNRWDHNSMGLNGIDICIQYACFAKRHASHFCRCSFVATGNTIDFSLFSTHSAAIMLSSVLSIQYKIYVYSNYIVYFLHERKKNVYTYVYPQFLKLCVQSIVFSVSTNDKKSCI